MKIELNNIEKLREIIINQAQENSSQKEQIETLVVQNKYMQERIDQLTRMLFTSKSEKLQTIGTIGNRGQGVPRRRNN